MAMFTLNLDRLFGQVAFISKGIFFKVIVLKLKEYEFLVLVIIFNISNEYY